MDIPKAILAVLLAPALLAPAPPVRADIYGFVDENGTAHFSNIPLDSRYRLYRRDPGARPRVEYGVPDDDARGGVRSNLPRAGGGRYADLIREVAREERIDAALLHAVIAVESAYNARALSPKGATGLMQLMPETARRYAVADVWDPAQNLRGGARYLRDLLRLFDDDLTLALAAYNAGEEAVVRAGHRIPPFAETRSYVPRVLAHYARYRAGVRSH